MHTSPVASTVPHSSNPVTAKTETESNPLNYKNYLVKFNEKVKKKKKKINDLFLPAFSAKAGVYTQTPI